MFKVEFGDTDVHRINAVVMSFNSLLPVGFTKQQEIGFQVNLTGNLRSEDIDTGERLSPTETNDTSVPPELEDEFVGLPTNNRLSEVDKQVGVVFPMAATEVEELVEAATGCCNPQAGPGPAELFFRQGELDYVMLDVKRKCPDAVAWFRHICAAS